MIINRVGCLNFKAENVSQNIWSLDAKIRFKYFKQSNGQFRLKEKIFLNELDKNILKLEQETGKIKKDIMYLDLDYYLDIDIVDLVKFLSKYIIDLECLQTKDSKFFNVDNVYTQKKYEMYYDDVLIDTETFVDNRLYNKLDINSSISLMLGVSEDEMLKNVFVKMNSKFYNDRFTAPVISKEDAKILVKEANGLKLGKIHLKKKF